MGIPVKLQEFEGPLDLLLHLIDKNKVSIFDIPIVEITNQYMEYIQAMETADMGVMSEFLVMAATLLDIKSRMLLPPEKDEEGEPQDPRQELVERLLEHKLYKYMSYELRDRQGDAAKAAYRQMDMPEEVLKYREPVDVQALLSGVTLARLNEIFQDVMKRRDARMDPVRSQFGTMEKEEVDLDETIAHVESYIAGHKKCSFRSLLRNRKSKMQVIITFLTILEMMKTGKIEIEQDDIFADILITAK
ncbi:ScpA/B protein [Marvinbryantia formatexigens DSM 14469]|uniref:Segregation and condensation protein A n=1 Tax=Marvinbryantia formatexigens DSM 14469 TaxID=478749 RepID=C6LME2_9FIRM|nr:segregation/condensation protein A [Marvinbryantia formatexigens]EET58203.1 ScpA/B protein [Marvinbryantia formatexigens DSM 14469]UWO25480.1 segregation/condensation protein A [Marvinbryantia formatexigens DSM 14469]SDG91356.1 condensin subunit ScpA [Marvinbryantia formatexigens]